MHLMRGTLLLGLLSVVLLPALAGPSAAATPAASLVVVSSDAKGVTLRLDVPAPNLSPPGPDGRARITVVGLDAIGAPGRPSLPVASGLVALPPGARARAHVTTSSSEDQTTGLRLVVGGKPGFRDDGGRLGKVPMIEPVAPLADGPWPTSTVELGEPFTIRGQRLVAVRVQPVRYDEASATVWVRRSLTVRIDFEGASAGAAAAGMPGPADAVLEQSVLNYADARVWRTPLEPARTSALELLSAKGRGIKLQGAPPAFDENNEEVRCVIDTTGVFSMSFANLSTKGFPSGIPVSQISVHRHEYVPGANPPYVTVEIPIEVDDRNSDGVFNNLDRVFVFVQNWAERSRASIAQRAWGDAEVVYVTYKSGGGARLTSRPGTIAPPMPPLASYKTRQHFEKSTKFVKVFEQSISDTNTDQFLWTEARYIDPNDPEANFAFEANDMDSSRPVDFRVQWVGLLASINFGPAIHSTWVGVRNGANVWSTVVDSAQWAGRQTKTFNTQLPGTSITNGRTNNLRILGRTIGEENGRLYAGLNWFEVEYARRYKALSGRLACNSDATVGPYQIMATGFGTRAIRVWDVTDSLAPVALALDDSLISPTAPYSVRFQDTSPTGAMRRYMVFDFPTALPAAKMSAVTRSQLTRQGTQDLLLVTPEAFFTSADRPAERLAQHRRTQGLRVLVCPLESVNDEFNGGRKSVYSVRRLLEFAYSNWNSRFVTLLGDGNQDPLNQTGTAGPDLIPVQRIAEPVGLGEGIATVYESIVSDPWYVWCLGRTRVKPYLQDMAIGRLPVSTPEQASDVVDKLITYDDVQPGQDWRRKFLLSADDQYSTSTFTGGTTAYCYKGDEVAFRALSDNTKLLLQNEGGYPESDIEVWDLAPYLAGAIPVYYDAAQFDSCRGIDANDHDIWRNTQIYTHANVTPELFRRLNEGRLWWNFEGHANIAVLTHEDLYLNRYSENDVVNLTNVDKPFFFTAFSCHPNAFGDVDEGSDVGPALGEEMVTIARKGAIATWASSGYELLTFDYTSHLTQQIARALLTTPPRDPYLGQVGARAQLGESVRLAILTNWAHLQGGLEGDVGISYQLLGDPATPITIGTPLSIVTANTQAVASGTPVRLHSSGTTVQIEADLLSNVYLSSIAVDSTQGGVTTMLPASRYTLTPAFPDTSAASYGGRRFHLSMAANLTTLDRTYTIRTTDRYGVPSQFDVVFQFQTVLRAGGSPVADREAISSKAPLSLTVLSPVPLTLPADLTVTINGDRVDYVATPANGDLTGREWDLSLPHADFPVGEYAVLASATGGGTSTHVFVIDTDSDKVDLRNAYAFPNPFDDSGTYFSFRLDGVAPADVQLRVYTIAGKLVYKNTTYGLPPGYRQIPWNGLDAEGQGIANGMYIYRLVATDGSTSAKFEGRLVKLRRPHRASDESSSTTP